MSRAPYLVPLALALGAMACTLTSGGAAPTPTSLIPTGVPPTVEPPATAITAPDASPTPDEDTGQGGDQPRFSGPVIFTTDPNSSTGQANFPAGTEQLWAVWDYSGMNQGDVVRRVWTLDGQEWIVREEAWDFARYGASGTVRDISIYDFDSGSGLPGGAYRLELYINGVLQNPPDGGGDTFSIAEGLPLDGDTFPSPDGSRTIVWQNGRTLLLKDGPTLAEDPNIIQLEWFPDNRHLLYVTLDKSEGPEGPTFLWEWDMWVVDTDTIQSWQLEEGDEQLHDAAINEDGSVVAVMRGSGYGDAGMVDLALAFVYLDVTYHRNTLVEAREFNGLPAEAGGEIYPVRAPGLDLPGEWVGLATFHAGMQETFDWPAFESGVWAFTVRDRMAGRVGDFPS